MIADKAQMQALITDWNKIPVEIPFEGIERQMVVGENIKIGRAHV